MTEKRAVLLVEDDAVTREVLQMLLEAAGWSVMSAIDGDAALRTLDEQEVAPALVLSDLNMPGIAGAALGRALRERLDRLDGGRKTVLLAMTATPSAGPVPPFAGVLVKPFDASAVDASWQAARVSALEATQVSQESPTQAADGPEGSLDPLVWERLCAGMPASAVRALCAMALEDGAKRVGRMRSAAALHDDEAFRREAHALKGSWGMIGAQRLSLLARDAERFGLSKAAGIDPATLVEELLNETANLRLMLERLVTGELPPV